MNVKTKRTVTKNLIKTILFYVVALLAAFSLNAVSPSGLCTPGFGIMLFLFLPVASFVLLIIFFKSTITVTKQLSTPQRYICYL